MKRWQEITLILAALLWGVVSAANAQLVPGSLLLSRNLDEEQNTSLGHWNHVAVAVSPRELVESQINVGVQRITLEQYLARPYAPALVLSPLDRAAGERAAKTAASLVGKKFRKLSSIFRRMGERRQEKGLNCVSIAKLSWEAESRKVRRIKKPDDCLNLKELFAAPQPLTAPKPLPPQTSGAELKAGFSSQSANKGSGTPANYSVAESRLFEAINRYRAARKLCPLHLDFTLMRIARQRVGVFNHNHPRYGWVKEHARREGFSGFATDNLAQGYESPEAAVGNARTGWGDERPGHTVGHDMQMKGYAKVNGRWVNYRFNRVGVAVRGRTYIAVFGVDSQKQRIAELSR